MQKIFQGSTLHFIGICGSSMSALAKMASEMGAKVTGSDSGKVNESQFPLNITIVNENCFQAIKNADIVIYTIAIQEDDEELQYAKSLAKPLMQRSEFLGYMSTLFDKLIAVSGTHGKSTVTGMLACIFMEAGRGFSLHLGGILRNIYSNYLLNGYEVLITEACEYKRSFLTLAPCHSIITNIEAEHMDFYSDLDEIYSAYSAFVNNLRNNGVLLVSEETDIKRLKISDDLIVYSYGISKGNFNARRLIENEEGQSFSVFFNEEYISDVKIKQKGRFNVENATAAFGLSYLYGLSIDDIIKGLSKFEGIKRRQELIKSLNNCAVYHDYAHHPSELKATMSIFEGKKIIAVFEPHTYSRTKFLFEEFVEILNQAYFTLILPTYSARETADDGVDAFALFKAIGCEKEYAPDYLSAKNIIEQLSFEENAVIILFGAGNIDKLGDML